jgi:N-acetylmuramoyl-L-alanine amidase
MRASLIIITLLTLVGCQSQSVVDNLPQPNFNGPNVAAAPIVVQPMPQIAPAPAIAKADPTPAYVGSVPRDWIPNAGAHRDWYWIVIHHSASPSGSMRDFDREHKQKGWDECGYDFVIGNGTNSRNGQVEVGPRWPVQKYGAHAYTPDERFNQHGIGICLVGNFDIDRPTAAQMQSLTKLVTYLMKTYHIPANRVLGHKDTKPTDCPGRNFNVAAVRRLVSQQVANAGPIDDAITDADPIPAGAELLKDDTQADAN